MVYNRYSIIDSCVQVTQGLNDSEENPDILY